MSGGVDSTAAALLLLEQGFEIAGGTFRLFDAPHGQAADSPAEDAAAACRALGIPHYTFDFREIFKKKVLDRFAEEYDRGRTPNPCVLCNREIKFGAFLDAAREYGYDRVATGHYARVEYDGAQTLYRVRRAACAEKDQSYVLYTLSQTRLAAAEFPLGNFSKADARRLAQAHGLAAAKKPESQDICFVPDGDYAAFLCGYLGTKSPPGDFLGENGEILGRHRGVRHYTIGQRRGIGLSFSQPMFVAGIDAEANTVKLAPNEALMRSSLNVSGLNWIEPLKTDVPLRLEVKLRYGAKPAAATVYASGETAAVVFDEPQRAVTPGQSAVFYNGEYLVGGGVIDG